MSSASSVAEGEPAPVIRAEEVSHHFGSGDLRRTLERGGDVRTLAIADLMTRGPRTIGPDRLAAEAVEIMESRRINQLLVVDGEGRLAGALNMHDLFYFSSVLKTANSICTK